MWEPLVSVVLPVRRETEYLDTAVRSVQRQSHDPIELVVVHSGDPAAFPEGLRAEEEVTYVHQEPTGVAAARNEGLDVASGDVVGFCDADDFWHPDKLAEQLPALEGGADVVYSDEFLVRDGITHRIESLPVTDPGRHHVEFFRNGEGVGSRSVLARAECFERERFDTRFELREDPHLWTRLFAQFHPARVAKPLSYKRSREDSLSSDVDLAYRMERLEIVDLVDRYPELASHREQRERQLRYRYAKRLLSEDGRNRDARRVLLETLWEGDATPRTIALLALALLPGGHRAATRSTQAALWRIRALHRRLTGDGYPAAVAERDLPTGRDHRRG